MNNVYVSRYSTRVKTVYSYIDHRRWVLSWVLSFSSSIVDPLGSYLNRIVKLFWTLDRIYDLDKKSLCVSDIEPVPTERGHKVTFDPHRQILRISISPKRSMSSALITAIDLFFFWSISFLCKYIWTHVVVNDTLSPSRCFDYTLSLATIMPHVLATFFFQPIERERSVRSYVHSTKRVEHLLQYLSLHLPLRDLTLKDNDHIQLYEMHPSVSVHRWLACSILAVLNQCRS